MTRTEIINYYIRKHGYKSYLEIGVYDKKNFNAINCKRKLSVDPEPTAKADVVKTSDDFFATNRETFDCIFVDGFHHADYATRDIQNSLSWLSENGTIIVHDCNPTTYEMQVTPRQQGVWTGDVWRAWMHYREKPFLKMFVHDCDYGVGIIQRGEQKIITTINPSYEDFAKHKTHWLPLVPPPAEISVVIPTYDQRGKGREHLRQLLASLQKQEGVLYEVCISDNGNIQDVLNEFPEMNIRYQRNPVTGISHNTNAAIAMASCDKIKIMYQDDMFNGKESLLQFCKALEKSGWVISGGISIDEHGRMMRRTSPHFSATEFTKNMTGMPSVIGFNKCEVRFDTELKTFLDLDFYFQLFRAYGMPAMINQPLIKQRYHPAAQSRNQPDMRKEESVILRWRYGKQ